MRDLHTDLLSVQTPPRHLHQPEHPHEIVMSAASEMVGVQPDHSQGRVAVIEAVFKHRDDGCEVLSADIEAVEHQLEDGKFSARGKDLLYVGFEVGLYRDFEVREVAVGIALERNLSYCVGVEMMQGQILGEVQALVMGEVLSRALQDQWVDVRHPKDKLNYV